MDPSSPEFWIAAAERFRIRRTVSPQQVRRLMTASRETSSADEDDESDEVLRQYLDADIYRRYKQLKDAGTFIFSKRS